ncbi:O-antigen ligase family protein [Candidatus Uhrbacteria bacterium]|nr:O-antigen ligase family protein [Candidatus Uhrbacteria bacterium]
MLPIYLIVTAAFALIAWRDLRFSLLLLIALLPSYLLRTEIFGVPTTLLEMMLIVFVIVWFVKNGVSPIFKGGSRGVTVAMTLLLLASLISLIIAPDHLSALGVWKAYFLEPILLFFIIRSEKLDATRIFKALGLTALVLSIVAIAQWVTTKGIPIPWDFERRVTSVFDYPNALGLFLGPIVILGFMSWRTTSRWFWILTIVLSTTAIVLAQSEAAIVAVLATLLIIGLTNPKTKNGTAVAFFVCAALIALSPWRGFMIEKLTLQDYSGQVRLTQWSETFEMLKDHWFLGAGLSGYPTVFERYHKAIHIEIFQYPHNILLNIWVELGVLGVIAFGLLAFQVLRTVPPTSSPFSALGRARPTGEASPPLIAFFALLETTIHGLVDVPYFKNDLAILTWILLAIVCTYAPHTPPAQNKKE